MIPPIEIGCHQEVLILFFALDTDSAMPQRPDDQLAPDTGVPNPVTTTRLPLNAGAGQDNSNA